MNRKRLVALILPKRHGQRRREKKLAKPSVSTGAPLSGGQWLLPDEELTGQSRKVGWHEAEGDPLGRKP